jgi:two-component system, cell cycle response regulator
MKTLVSNLSLTNLSYTIRLGEKVDIQRDFASSTSAPLDMPVTNWSAHSYIDTNHTEEKRDSKLSAVASNPNKFRFAYDSLIEQLQSTLDINELLTIYLDAIGNTFKINAIEFTCIYGEFSIGLTPENTHRVTLPLHTGKDVIGQLTYFTSRPFKGLIQNSLNEIQAKLYYPLKHGMQLYKLQQLVMKDPLTGADNRASFDQQIERSVLSARRHGSDFTLMLLDLDNFKQVNDNHGHLTGDDVLQSFVELTQNALRGNDQLFRFGGDEFAIILEHNQLRDSNVIAQRLTHDFQNSELAKGFGISVSIGYTHFCYSDNEQTLFERADQALYSAKREGKNCVRCA